MFEIRRENGGWFATRNGETRRIGSEYGGFNLDPGFTGVECTNCGFDPGNGASGYSECCSMPEEQTSYFSEEQRQEWVAQHWDGLPVV